MKYALETGNTDGHTDNAIGLMAAEKNSSQMGDTHAHTHFQCKEKDLVLCTSIILNVYIHNFAWCFKQLAKFGGIWLKSAQKLLKKGLGN